MTTTPSLTDTQRIVLAELASRGDLPRSALTQAASVSHNTISRTVDVLKFRGLIVDGERTKGRALSYLSITDAGRYALANPDAPMAADEEKRVAAPARLVVAVPILPRKPYYRNEGNAHILSRGLLT